LRKLSFKIIHSTTILLPAWKSILKTLELPPRIMPWNVLTRWNLTFDMLNFALQYQKAIDAITDKHKLGLGEYSLEDDDWMLAKQLRDVLKDATLYFSRGTPNLAMVIPAMDHIDTMFTNGIVQNKHFNPAIRTALGLAKCTLNRYYSCTDSSVVYRIAMGRCFII
ncbi:hypothetical protein CY34DRAFT_88720, partial [Suillus luteus UH-Slu-Lm8-n1]